MARSQSLKRSFGFVGILLLMLLFLQWIIDTGVRHSTEGYFNKVNLLVKEHRDVRVAFFGSSVGEVAFDIPLIENQTSSSAYNFCIDGTRFAQYEGLIREFNQFSDSCEVVVLAETFFSLSKIDKITEPERYLGYLNNENVYQSLFNIQPDLMWKARYVPFYKFILMSQRYYKASANGWSNFIQKKGSDPLRGFTPKYKTWERGLDQLNARSKPIYIEIDSITLKRYMKMVREIVSHGRKVLIVIPPIHKDGLKLLPNLQQLRDAFSSITQESVCFKDFSGSDFFNEKAYYYNNSHLNYNGAKRFSYAIGEKIDSLLKLPHVKNHRSSIETLLE